MRNRLVILTAATSAVAIGLVAPRARAGVATLDASRDNTLYNYTAFSVEVSNGAGPYLFVGQTIHEGPRRAVIGFDIPASVPTNAQITSAALDLVVSRSHLSSNVELHRLTKDWGEAGSNAGDPGGGGTTPEPGDATWTYNFYNTSTWTTPGGDFDSTASATTSMGFGVNQFTSAQMASDVQGWVNNPAASYGWLLKGQESISQSANRIDSKDNPDSVPPQLTVGYNASTWKTPGAAAWSSNANWDFGVPGGIGHEANFSFSSGAPGSVITVNVDGPRTLGYLNFDSTNNYLLTGSTITLDRSGNHSSVYVAAGDHTIATSLVLDTVTDFTVDSGAILRVNQNLTGAAPGSVVNKFGDGALRTPRIRDVALEITGGSVITSPNGTATGVSIVNGLSIGPGATLDLADNDLIARNTPYTTVRSAVAFGSIISSTSTGSQVLALFDNTIAARTAWEGFTVGANTIIGKYTYLGDVNIDGQVTGDDYTIVDSNLNTTPLVGVEWLRGDANRDGNITGDDYTVIDSNLGMGVGNPLSPAQLSPVPEPASLSLLSLAALSLLRRRR